MKVSLFVFCRYIGFQNASASLGVPVRGNDHMFVDSCRHIKVIPRFFARQFQPGLQVTTQALRQDAVNWMLSLNESSTKLLSDFFDTLRPFATPPYDHSCSNAAQKTSWYENRSSPGWPFEPIQAPHRATKKDLGIKC